MRGPQWEKPDDLRALAEDYLKDPGPKATAAFAQRLLSNVLARRHGLFEPSPEQPEERQHPKAGRLSRKGSFQSDLGQQQSCYAIGNNAEGTSETNVHRGPEEGHGGPCAAPEGSGRGCDAETETETEKDEAQKGVAL